MSGALTHRAEPFRARRSRFKWNYRSHSLTYLQFNCWYCWSTWLCKFVALGTCK